MLYYSIMKNNHYKKTKKAFSLPEVLLTLVILGIIMMIAIPQLKIFNPRQRGFDTRAKKMEEYFTEAIGHILQHDCSLDDLTIINLDSGEKFSIADPHNEAKLAEIFKKYILYLDRQPNVSVEYFTAPIKDYDKTPIGVTLEETYKNFFFAQDGTLIGFRSYGSCEATELNTNPSLQRGRYTQPNVCASIFFDINGENKPNKLGSDQYVLPLYKRGIKYTNGDI